MNQKQNQRIIFPLLLTWEDDDSNKFRQKKSCGDMQTAAAADALQNVNNALLWL